MHFHLALKYIILVLLRVRVLEIRFNNNPSFEINFSGFLNYDFSETV